MPQSYREVNTGQTVTPDDDHAPWFAAQARWEPVDTPKPARKRTTKKTED